MFCTVNPTLSNTQGQLKYVLIRENSFELFGCMDNNRGKKGKLN